MKNFVITILFFLIFQINYSQQKGVENSIFNFQTGFFGIWINNETKLSTSLSLRTEVGLDAGIFGTSQNNVGLILSPVINLEPRWYYNINKRQDKNKNILNNSANFLTILFGYHPDWFVISKDNNVNVYNQLSIIPKWGIRRNILKSNFNFEAGIGLGYRYYFLENYNFSKNYGETVLDLHLRIGYTFIKLNKQK